MEDGRGRKLLEIGDNGSALSMLEEGNLVFGSVEKILLCGR